MGSAGAAPDSGPRSAAGFSPAADGAQAFSDISHASR